jgi:hypothetical protein
MLDIIGAMSAHTPKTTTTKKQSWLCRPDHMFFKGTTQHTQCTILSSPLNVVQVQLLLWSKLSN